MNAEGWRRCQEPSQTEWSLLVSRTWCCFRLIFWFVFRTGALIGRRTVITAAHCVDPARKGATLAQLKAGFVRVGGNQLTKGRQYKVSSTPHLLLSHCPSPGHGNCLLLLLPSTVHPMPPGGHHSTA